jgi:hypothetical protein
MSRLARSVGYWVGLMLKKMIKPDTNATQSYSFIAAIELAERVNALESLSKVMAEKIQTLDTSLSIAELHLISLQRSSSGSKTADNSNSGTEATTQSPGSPKKVTLH